jgi:hypothetical protein
MIRTKFRMSGRDRGRRDASEPTLGRARPARGAIGADYKRTTKRMTQLYGPLKARRCITRAFARARAYARRARIAFCPARLPRELAPRLAGEIARSAINMAVY